MSNNAHSRGLALAGRCSTALACVQGLAAALSLAVPSVFKDPPGYAGNARGTAVAILFIALPALIVSMRAGVRGSARGQVVWLGTLAYLVYNAVIFAFAVIFNRLFPLYVAALALAVWSLVALAVSLDLPSFASRFDEQLPVRGIGAYLVAVSTGFAALWLADVVPALISNGMPAGLRGTSLPTNPIEVLDFAFTLPLAALGGIWLLRRRPWGYAVSGPMLVMLTIEGVSVAIDQTFGHLADPTQPLSAVPVFVVLTVVSLVPTLLYLRHLRDAPGPGVSGFARHRYRRTPTETPSWSGDNAS